MRTYTISKSELETVGNLTVAVATTVSGPKQPTQIRQLSAGWIGAEWVRFVADYQDAASVGYASMDDLELDHDWTADMGAEFEAVES